MSQIRVSYSASFTQQPRKLSPTYYVLRGLWFDNTINHKRKHCWWRDVCTFHFNISTIASDQLFLRIIAPTPFHFDIQFNSILYSLKTPDHWYMRYNMIIYKLQWFTGEGHKKGKAKYNKCKKRKNKYKIHANVVKKKSGRTDII